LHGNRAKKLSFPKQDGRSETGNFLKACPQWKKQEGYRMPDLMESIKAFASAIPAELKGGKNDTYEFEHVVAERKAFLSKKKLVYKAEFRLDNNNRKMHFTEMLKESGFGLSSGGDDMDMSPGGGFKKGTYKTGMQGREGTIEEQSKLFGKAYNYSFDFGAIRNKFKGVAEDSGYAFEYHIIGLGK
jgi:hypothetical protein